MENRNIIFGKALNDLLEKNDDESKIKVKNVITFYRIFSIFLKSFSILIGISMIFSLTNTWFVTDNILNKVFYLILEFVIAAFLYSIGNIFSSSARSLKKKMKINEIAFEQAFEGNIKDKYQTPTTEVETPTEHTIIESPSDINEIVYEKRKSPKHKTKKAKRYNYLTDPEYNTNPNDEIFYDETNEKKCEFCGTRNELSAKKCETCGNKFD